MRSDPCADHQPRVQRLRLQLAKNSAGWVTGALTGTLGPYAAKIWQLDLFRCPTALTGRDMVGAQAVGTKNPVAQVDAPNSIVGRTVALLQHLHSVEPEVGWGQFMAPAFSTADDGNLYGAGTQLNWAKIVVGGHSRGSSYPPLIAKLFKAHRVFSVGGIADVIGNVSGDPVFGAEAPHWLSSLPNVMDLSDIYALNPGFEGTVRGHHIHLACCSVQGLLPILLEFRSELPLRHPCRNGKRWTTTPSRRGRLAMPHSRGHRPRLTQPPWRQHSVALAFCGTLRSVRTPPRRTCALAPVMAGSRRIRMVTHCLRRYGSTY
eukprot:SAG11_NODE_1678_length_4468_cov_14.717784_3_plen_319_part_00